MAELFTFEVVVIFLFWGWTDEQTDERTNLTIIMTKDTVPRHRSGLKFNLGSLLIPQDTFEVLGHFSLKIDLKRPKKCMFNFLSITIDIIMKLPLVFNVELHFKDPSRESQHWNIQGHLYGVNKFHKWPKMATLGYLWFLFTLHKLLHKFPCWNPLKKL